MSSTPRLLLPRSTPEDAGIVPAGIADLVRALDESGGAHSLMVVRHGRVVAEHWWHPHAADQRHTMFSVSKTFTAMAVGLAVHEGLITLDDRVVELLADDLPADPSDNLRAMTVRHLLTMTAGFEFDTMNAITDDEMPWVRTILAVPVVRAPGSRFLYDTGVTHLLAAIMHRVTGQRLLDWLTPRLLAPLGIEGATWQQSSEGIDAGGFGMNLTSEHMAAFGQLLLQGGRWGDSQLIPAEWVADATRHHSDPSVMGWGPESMVGYGYQLWHCTARGAYRADGAFGQFIVVWPEHKAVVVITSGLPFETQNEQLARIWRHLEPAFDRAPAEPTASRADLHLPLPSGSAWPEGLGDLAFAWEGGSLAVRRDGELAVIETAELTVAAGLGAWFDNGPRVPVDGEHRILFGAYAWADERTLVIRGAVTGTPYVRTATIALAADGETADIVIEQNAGFGSLELVRATAATVLQPTA